MISFIVTDSVFYSLTSDSQREIW